MPNGCFSLLFLASVKGCTMITSVAFFRVPINLLEPRGELKRANMRFPLRLNAFPLHPVCA